MVSYHALVSVAAPLWRVFWVGHVPGGRQEFFPPGRVGEFSDVARFSPASDPRLTPAEMKYSRLENFVCMIAAKYLMLTT